VAAGRPTADNFRLARTARTRYGLADLTLAADLATARTIAARVNAGRAGTPGPAMPGLPPAGAAAIRRLTTGELHAAGLLVSILGRLIDRYCAEADPTAVPAADAWLREWLGHRPLEAAVAAFTTEFPARLSIPESPDPGIALTQLLLLGALDENRAVDPFRELVDLRAVREGRPFEPVVDGLATFFEQRPGFGPEGRSLVELLRQPAAAAPDSLAGQLRWIREHWTGLFGTALDDLLDRLLVALDVLAEERRAAELAWFAVRDPGAGGPAEVYDFSGEAGEPERFSEDRDWMPRLVLLAKSTYVWLDQLSRRHGREIRTLDAIPDEELDALASWGISGLWLIGLWERSLASERIKRLRGQHDAVASAYSLDDYVIAADLGGPAALDELARRAGARGIRLASDMVPNHMGIDSRWLIEHPDRFLSLPDSPFPSYAFNGPDLSSDERVGIFLEDHYYDASDAAVVFKRVDRRSGDVRYVYHGNDGTSFPWNDTAQLDYSKAQVREAVTQAILHVARQFPVIRFDAAMVLARKHVKRLWFPEPGHGGAIPSRAGHGMTRAEFDRAMPREFWREVVDRVAAEVPGTLLLAEAFWLLEGYFVRTLGMHRVYNSAFMNMLRDEKNAEYRLVIRNTLEFDPAILGRFVNFMSNPDERTAVDQFGTGDRYFGVAALMATLPGLPMLGHGQVEGFTERYGMEFRRARLDEPVDTGLLEHHRRTIFPLLHRRAIFAEAHGFRLYDAVTDDGTVNEDVFAYSNVGPDGQRSLVLFHNRHAQTSVRMRDSVGFMAREADGERRLRRETLGEGLGLSGAPDRFVVVRDAMSGLEHLWSSAETAEHGLRVELGPYRCHVFVDLAEMADGPRPVARLHAELGGRGVPSIDEALLWLELEPVHADVRARLAGAFAAAEVAEAAEAAKRPATAPPATKRPTKRPTRKPTTKPTDKPTARATEPGPTAAGRLAEREVALLVAAVRTLEGEPFDDRRLGPIVRDALAAAGHDPAAADRGARIVRGLVVATASLRALDDATIAAWFADPTFRDALRVHEASGATWFEREAFERLVAAVGRLALTTTNRPAELAALAEAAGYRVELLLAAVHPSATRLES
jgi:glycosidase